jgi:hypothetical protein
MDKKVIKTSLQPKKHNGILNFLVVMVSFLGSVSWICYCN